MTAGKAARRPRSAPAAGPDVAGDTGIGDTGRGETRRGAGLVLAHIGADGGVALDRVAERLGLSKAQLAEMMGVRPETVYRGDRARARKTQARATELLEIVGRIADWAGGERQALAWYRAEPIAAFGGRTAEALVKDGRAGAVRDYLDHVATGGFA